jgi:hypothetical protein
VEAHHIVPSAEGGPNDIDNAAPLCPNCHSWFGDNLKKRKEIRQMRDWWYEVVTEKYPLREVEERLNEALVEGQANQTQQIEALRALVEDVSTRLEEVGAGADSGGDLQSVATTLVQATRLGEGVYANFTVESATRASGCSSEATAVRTAANPWKARSALHRSR